MGNTVSVDASGRLVPSVLDFDPTDLVAWWHATLDLWNSDPAGLKVALHERAVALKRAEDEIAANAVLRAALAEIADLPGPHYSEATKRAVRLARRALEAGDE